MIEEPKEKQAEDYPFINEKIVPKRKKRWMRKLGTMLFVVCMAAVFGVVAQLVFLLSGEYLREWLHIETERQQVNLPQPTKVEGEGMVTRKPRQTATPIVKEWSEHIVPTKIPANQIQGTLPTPSPVTGQAEPQQTPVPEPTATKVPTINPPVPTKQPENKEENTEYYLTTDTSLLYLQMYDAIRTVAEEVSDSLVIVEAIEQGVDWFQEVYENRTRTTGLILGNDGVDLLILVGTEQFSGATSLNVFFGEEVLSGRIYSMDRDYGLAVIAVSLSELSEELLEQIQMGLPAQKEDIVIGTPVIALGAPNGYEGSMEFGMITSLGSTVSVTDGELAYFTTNPYPSV